MKLKPCTHCKADDASVFVEGSDHYVFCACCGARGPVCPTPERAAEAWDRREGERELVEGLALYISAYPHHAPEDCFSTGPMTGDNIQDLVTCPGCAAQKQARALIAKHGEGE